MAKYQVRSGQNIYDVALTLYGSVEGIFDLLVSNRWLTMETVLSYGMVLNYHEDFAINDSIVLWLQNKGILVKNGDHTYNHIDIESFITKHIKENHPDLYAYVETLSPDEQNIYWEGLYLPRMIIHHYGATSDIKMILRPDTHLIVDWGDYTAPFNVEGNTLQEIEHCYKGNGRHIITFYGDFEFEKLDFTEVNGIYYPLGTIYADEFITTSDAEDINKLIVTQ